jgi:lauroyl/myristoyl acyltransferase
VLGSDHLEAALGQRQGVILVSAHFGLPPLIRLALEGLGARVIGVGRNPAPGVDVAVGADVWNRARSLQRLRDELAENRVCLLLADGGRGRHTEVPFLGGRIRVSLGAFGLAQVTRSPLLPVFAVLARGAPRFQVDIGPALPVPHHSGAEPPTEAIAGFVRRYEALARTNPCQLFGYAPLFASRAPSS